MSQRRVPYSRDLILAVTALLIVVAPLTGNQAWSKSAKKQETPDVVSSPTPAQQQSEEVFVPHARGFAVQGEYATPAEVKHLAQQNADRRANELAAGVEVVSLETLYSTNNSELYSEYITAKQRSDLRNRKILRSFEGERAGEKGWFVDIQATVLLKKSQSPAYSLEFEVVNSDGQPTTVFSAGSLLFMRFRATRPVYVTVIAFNKDGSADVLLPSAMSKPYLEETGTWYTFPDRKKETLPLYLNEGVRQEDIVLIALATETDYDPPAWKFGSYHPSASEGLEAFTKWYMDNIPEQQQRIVNRAITIRKN
jgi:hypothetical protein